MNEEYLVCVKADDVGFDEGFTEFDGQQMDQLFRLLTTARIKRRSEVEDDDTQKQIVVYTIVRDRRCRDVVYAYQRSSGDNRLVNSWSIGIGGHVNINDVIDAGYSYVHSVYKAVRRELLEEMTIYSSGAYTDIEWIGVINDNSNPVGRAHLGVVMVVELDGGEAHANEEGISRGHLAEIDELMQFLETYESWSQLLILEYLGRV